jgi:NAD(P)-dependent dehydrogenase (short-subunit alcohol dehydrogenase family)
VQDDPVAGVDVGALFTLAGRTALVTGASSGLGARFAKVLHAAGAEVVVTARRAERLERLCAELGDRATAIPCDLADAGAREALVAQVHEAHGALDVLVNNAGVAPPGDALHEDVEQFRAVLEVNAVAPFHLSGLVAPGMIERGSGSIVNVASVLGLVGAAPLRMASYCASKGAVVNLTRELAMQWARKGVRVNALAPGWFASEMTADMWADPRARSYIESTTPMARAGDEAELDAALLLLAGAGGSFLTGQVITVDGGWTAR